jgi:K+ transporter
VSIEHVSDRLVLVRASFGYMEPPRIDPILAVCGAKGLRLDSDDTSFFYADPKLVRAEEKPMPAWQRRYFEFLLHNSRPLPDDLNIAAERRVELGVEVAL